MKRFLLLAFSVAVCLIAWGQKAIGTSTRTTLYETFQPAKIILSSGKVIFQKQANIFLKDASLLFKNGNQNMRANMTQIQEVEFADDRYVCIESMLAAVVDTVNGNKILRTTTIDLEAFRKMAINDRVVSSLSLGGDQVSMSSISLTDESDMEYPLINSYYFEVDGNVFKAHERVVYRRLPKNKRDRLQFYMDMPDFDWGDRTSLRQVLKLFEE